MEEKVNNFKKMMEEHYEARFELPPMGEIDPIHDKIMHRHASNCLKGDMTDLFMPKMLRAIAGIFGGNVAHDNDYNEHSRPAPDWGSHYTPTQPKAPGQK